MEMSIVLLPNDLDVSSAMNTSVCTFDYHISDAQLKNKINLTKNVFSFLLDGSKELIHAGRNTEIQNNQFLLIRSGNCLMTENLSPSKNYRSMLLFFEDEQLLNVIEKYESKKEISTVAKPFIVFDYDTYTRNFVQSIMYLNQLKSSGHELLMRTKCEEILLYLTQQHGPELMLRFLGHHQGLDSHFKSIVENNIHNLLTIGELAFLCNMSVSTFKRTFYKIYLESPIKWFQEKRLEHAAFLLAHKKERASDIYLNLGYESLSSFIQAFKRKFGSTPKQFHSEKMNFSQQF